MYVGNFVDDLLGGGIGTGSDSWLGSIYLASPKAGVTMKNIEKLYAEYGKTVRAIDVLNRRCEQLLTQINRLESQPADEKEDSKKSEKPPES